MAVVVREYHPGDAAAFRDINLAWIERFFAVEQKDRDVLGNPQKYILDPGGAILIADEAGETVGAVALMVMGGGSVELSKMCVLETAQGKGAGAMLGITGWAQVNGRNALEWDKRLQADLWYVDNWSLKLDIKIILMTIPVWLTASGISTPGFVTYQPLHELREKKARPAAVLPPVEPQSDAGAPKEMTPIDG